MPKTPRLLRPHSVSLIHDTKERGDDLKNITVQSIISYVNIDVNYAIKQSKRGIDTAVSAVMIIDLLDLVINDCAVSELVIEKDDVVLFNGHTFTITKIHEITNFINGKKEILEVFMNE